MTSAVEYEAMNEVAPLKNTDGMNAIAVLAISPTSQVIDLLTLFGNGKHFLTLQADTVPANGKVYVALGINEGTINDAATGVGITVCQSLKDGERLRVRLANHLGIATGVATLAFMRYLHWKGATGGATGYLRIHRSSLEPSQDSREFRAPNVY